MDDERWEEKRLEVLKRCIWSKGEVHDGYLPQRFFRVSPHVTVYVILDGSCGYIRVCVKIRGKEHPSKIIMDGTTRRVLFSRSVATDRWVGRGRMISKFVRSELGGILDAVPARLRGFFYAT